MLEAAIFDLDGTLLNTITDITKILNYGLSKYNFQTYDEKTCADMVGNGIEVLVKKALPIGVKHDQIFNEILSLVRQEYYKNPIENTVPYPGIPRLLDRFTKEKIPMAILTNKPHAAAIASVSQLLAEWKFTAVQGASGSQAPKPGKEAALLILKKMNINPNAVAMIGDSEVDIQTAKNTGMFSMAVSWGFRNRETLLAQEPNVIIDAPEEIITFYLHR